MTQTFLETLCRTLDQHDVAYALVGGYALALQGAPRRTLNLDIIVSFKEKSFVSVENALAAIGLQPRLPINAKEVFRFRKEYVKNRNLFAWSLSHPLQTTKIVNVILTRNLDDCSVVKKKIGETKVCVISKADLIKMKKKSGRKQDLLDVEALGKPVESRKISSTQIVEFLDQFRTIADAGTPSKSKLISVKVPESLLAAFKTKAQLEKRPYQTKIKELMRDWLLQDV